MTTFAAVDAVGGIKFVGDVPRGAACGCFCPTCNSPLVSKQGAVNSWHFAHEASQERPECIVGSINLLRRLAIEKLSTMHGGLPLPPYATTLQVHAGWKRFSESLEFRWPVATVQPIDWNLQAANAQAVATFLLWDGQASHSFGVFVQIGQEANELNTEGYDGVLVFSCPPPAEGQLRTQQDAVNYLVAEGDLYWRAVPDFAGARSRATAAIERQKAVFLAEEEANRAAGRNALLLERKRMLSMGGEQSEAPAPAAVPDNLPGWAVWKKPNSSFFAFGIATGECWVVMAADDFEGCYIVPIPLAFDGWDESLPPSLATPLPARECYTSSRTINEVNAWFMPRSKRGVQIDSDARTIERFAATVCSDRLHP